MALFRALTANAVEYELSTESCYNVEPFQRDKTYPIIKDTSLSFN